MFLNLNCICDPIIGCVPTDEIFSENSKAPDKLFVSLKPTDIILFFLQYSFRSSIFNAP